MNTQFIFFSGKGGVGKTSMACATAVHHADAGQRTLIITTDPAANLADVFEQPIGHHITPLDGIDNLWAMEIDPDTSHRGIQRTRPGSPPRRLSRADGGGHRRANERSLHGRSGRLRPLHRLSGAGQRADQPVHFDVIVFDTAPTGHTIRLLELPAEWAKRSAPLNTAAARPASARRRPFRAPN